jgi:hypothetical protein
VLGSLVLWSSHLVQVWWTSNAAVFALAPWPAVAFLARLRWHWRWAAIWYASAVWLIGLLYPPFIISGALGMGVLLLAFRRDAFTRSRLALAVSAVVAAIAVTWLYFHDIIDVMQGTVYPGQRRSVGGGVPLAMLAAHVFPYWTTVLTRPLLAGFNACDISVVASFLPLMFAVFTNFRSLADVMCANASTFGILIAGLTLMLTWMILPVPHEVGRFLLLDLVPANRTLWGFGLCLTAALVVVMTEVNWHITPLRCAVFVTLILAVQIVKAVLADPQGALADLARALPNWSLLQFPAARFALGYLGFDLVIPRSTTCS